MKTKLAVLFLLAGTCMFAGTHFYFGVGVGAPVGAYVAAPPPHRRQSRTPRPHPVLVMLMSVVITVPSEHATHGTVVIGLARLMLAHTGSPRTPSVIVITAATGAVNHLNTVPD